MEKARVVHFGSITCDDGLDDGDVAKRESVRNEGRMFFAIVGEVYDILVSDVYRMKLGRLKCEYHDPSNMDKPTDIAYTVHRQRRE